MTAEVSSLRPSARGLDLLVKVVDAKTVVNRPRNAKGEALKVVECIVGDSTGSILFTARNDQADLAQPGTYLALKNARVDVVRGNMRVVVDKFGKVEKADGQSFKPNTDFNLSLIEFELVAFDGTA